MRRILLMYPPGKAYQRGEDRCQGNLEDSSATNIHACNDLGYAAAGLDRNQYEIVIRDYQTEKCNPDQLIQDIKIFRPDLLFMSVTNATIYEDIEITNGLITILPELVIVLKGALFFDAGESTLNHLDLEHITYLIGGESDFIASKLIHRHFSGTDLSDLKGLLINTGNGWIKTDFSSWYDTADALPFPARDLMNNSLYVRPDTGEKQATITVARGCSASCTFCLTPVISGRKVRFRSSTSILNELRECYYSYGIRDFFLKSDTFTLNKEWVLELCREIEQSDLTGKIRWVANSRTRPLDLTTLTAMKRAGCWLVAFGFESGSNDTLSRLKKGTTVEDSIRAAGMARSAGLKIFGFFMAGFPWESDHHLKKTRNLIFRLKSDFIEIHIPVPYPGTEIYTSYEQAGLVSGNPYGKDYYRNPASGTCCLSSKELLAFRKQVLMHYYFRPSYLMNRCKDVFDQPVVLKQYATYAFRLAAQLAGIRVFR